MDTDPRWLVLNGLRGVGVTALLLCSLSRLAHLVVDSSSCRVGWLVQLVAIVRNLLSSMDF